MRIAICASSGSRGDEGARTAYRDFVSLTQEEKINLNFKEVVEAAECPDAVFILESKLTLEKLLKMKGFDEWRKSKGYIYVCAVWSRSTRNKAGYAGVVLLSKSQPHNHNRNRNRTITTA